MIIAFESKCLLLCVELNDELKELELINLLGHEKVKTGFYSIKIKKKNLRDDKKVGNKFHEIGDEQNLLAWQLQLFFMMIIYNDFMQKTARVREATQYDAHKYAINVPLTFFFALHSLMGFLIDFLISFHRFFSYTSMSLNDDNVN